MSRGLGDVYKRQLNTIAYFAISLLSSGDDLPESYRVEPKGLPYAARAADASGRLR